ncbi:flagellin [Pandoraea nosoerga]|uniref:Flagellin n=1 Tax=Pandoraea nosoerga TaxID=2508296 RepID=A0A5E4XY82_9BURK|nr:flagellin [Pandoraea nosoerga]MBN4664785.1 flagellin [Pandoraea nosoerga]MBN4674041.1 flagellin [Pandoraea nosoerga]MBN4680025.1 flagellin [Pandoraea nosoerga]MBN4744263.1 flagellin [Pandoraea nosoerga]VVE41247.1 flagellin [Pandoraea nosoerga]
MASVINTNIFSLVAQRNLSSSQGALQTSITRLSSGLRINSAADDAAGLAITDRMTAQVNGLTQAQRNANDGISLVQTAAGALSSITDNLQRIRTLAVQATNATNSDSDRAALDQEVQQRLAEINRTASQTQFNGLSVLNGTMGVANFQVGANAGQTISVNLTQSMTTSSIGAVAQANSTTNPLSFTIAAGDLTIADGGGTPIDVAAGTYNNANDLAAAINTAGAKAGFTANIASVNSSGQLVIANTDPAAALTIAGTAQGTLGLPGTINAGGAAVTSTGVAKQFQTTLSTGDLTFTVDGVAHDITGTFKSSADLATAINSANIGINAFVDSTGAMHISSGQSFAISSTNTGTPTTLQQLGLTAGTYTTSGSLATADVKTVNNATLMLSQIDAAITTVDSFNATLGATQNRFQSTISSLSTTTQNLTQARSGVQDTDYAAETASLTRSQILQQAGISMLSQANQLPQQVLKLLQ